MRLKTRRDHSLALDLGHKESPGILLKLLMLGTSGSWTQASMYFLSCQGDPNVQLRFRVTTSFVWGLQHCTYVRITWGDFTKHWCPDNTHRGADSTGWNQHHLKTPQGIPPGTQGQELLWLLIRICHRIHTVPCWENVDEKIRARPSVIPNPKTEGLNTTPKMVEKFISDHGFLSQRYSEISSSIYTT